MSAIKELVALEAAEIAYLRASGWTNHGGLWVDPADKRRSHIERMAAYKQRQRDTAEENARRGT